MARELRQLEDAKPEQPASNSSTTPHVGPSAAAAATAIDTLTPGAVPEAQQHTAGHNASVEGGAAWMAPFSHRVSRFSEQLTNLRRSLHQADPAASDEAEEVNTERPPAAAFEA